MIAAVIVVLVILLAVVGALYATGNLGGGGGDEKLTVSFVDGDSELSNVDIDKNSYVTEPAAPTKEGYIFAGWYSDSACTKEFDFKNTKITENTKIYAKFVANDEKFTVSFNTNGGSSIASQTINAGEKVTKPADPTKANNKFAGWYCDSALTQPYDFSSQVLSSFTLYAKWTAESGTYTVTFNSNGGSAVPAQTVKAGEKAVKPANPTKSGYSFSGWYSDASLITQYDFNSAVNADITLCAKWTSNGGGGGGGPVTPTTYTVTFCNNNETYATVSGITSGTSLGDKMPVDPFNGGYQFLGWNTASDGSGNAFTKTTKVNGNTTVYAKWSEIEVVIPPTQPTDKTASISESVDISDLVKTAEDNGSTTIAFNASGFTNPVDSILIPYSQISSMNDAISSSTTVDSVTLKTTEGTIVLSSAMLNNISTTVAQSNDIIISLSNVTDATDTPTLSGLPDDILSSAVVYDLSIKYDNGTPVSLNDTNTSTMYVTVPISEDYASSVVVFYVNDSGKLVSSCNVIDRGVDTITFETTHNSYYTIIQQPFKDSADGVLTKNNVDGKYEATFTLSETKPDVSAYDNYLVDFILTIDTKDNNGFTLDFSGKTYAKGSNDPLGVSLDKTGYQVGKDVTKLFFSDIYTAEKSIETYNFTVSKVWSAGAGGRAVAEVSNIRGLDEPADITLTMIMYKDTDAKAAGNYFVLSNTVPGTIVKPQTSEPQTAE